MSVLQLVDQHIIKTKKNSAEVLSCICVKYKAKTATDFA
jgi:hypothetical protein